MSMSSQPPIQIGEIIAGKYRTERVLGMGAMGVVVEATNIALQQRVALKFLLSARSAGDAVHERFLREARAAARLKSEHVARVMDVGILETGAPYMVMELLEGNDLAAELEKRGPLPISEAADYLLQACEAIAEAHAAGTVHRDLKPSNLFLSREATSVGRVKVFDFGVSKVADEGAKLTAAGQSVGSPLYMSPEQTRGSVDVDGRSDIWSLGVILYELVSGTTPFYADSLLDLMMNIVSHPYTPLRTYVPNVPPDLELIIALCLEKDPARRCPDIVTLAGMLATFAPPPPPAGSRVTATGNRRLSSGALPVPQFGTPAAGLPVAPVAAPYVLGAAPPVAGRGSSPSAVPIGVVAAGTAGGTTQPAPTLHTPSRSRLPLGLALGAVAIAGAVGGTYALMGSRHTAPASAASLATTEAAAPTASPDPAPSTPTAIAATSPNPSSAAPIVPAVEPAPTAATAVPAVASATASGTSPPAQLPLRPAAHAPLKPAVAPRPDLYGGRK